MKIIVCHLTFPELGVQIPPCSVCGVSMLFLCHAEFSRRPKAFSQMRCAMWNGLQPHSNPLLDNQLCEMEGWMDGICI